MKRITFLYILTFIITLMPMADGFCCTTIMTSKNGMVLAGHNKDINNTRLQMIFKPADEKNYGCFYVTWEDGWPRSGMNDQGLFIDANAVPDTGWHADPAKPYFRDNPRRHILNSCATIDDVRKFFETYNVPILSCERFPVADQTGAFMVVEYFDGKVRFVKENTWYQVSTNFLRSAYPDSEVPCDRFRIAQKLLDPARETSIGLIRSALSAVHLEDETPTAYSCIYDLKAGQINIYYFHNFEEVVTFSLAVELKKGFQSFELSDCFSQRPYVAKYFQDRQAKFSRPILMEIYKQSGSSTALMRYRHMCLDSRRVSDYDIGPGQITHLAATILQSGDADMALAFYIELCRYFPDSWEAHEGIGRVQMILNHKAEAIVALRRSLAIKPDNVWAADILKRLE